MSDDSKSFDNDLAHDEVERENLIDLYVLGQLQPEHAQRFERHFLACPECLERLELTETLVAGLRVGAARDLSALRLGLWASLWQHRKWSSAFLLLLLLPSLLLYRQLDDAQDRLQSASSALASFEQPQAGALFLPLGPRRDLSGASPSHIARLPVEPGWLVLSLELELGTEQSYRVHLFDAHESLLWQSDPLNPNSFDALVVTIPSTFLKTGDYMLLATPGASEVAEAGEVSSHGIRFDFRAIAP